MASTEAEEELAKDVAAQVMKRLRANQPYMNVPAIAEICNKVQRTIREGVEAQLPAIAESRGRISFLHLPPELRNNIYQLFIFDNTRKACNELEQPKIKYAQPALSRVCRQLREEFLPVFYGQSAFELVARCSGSDNIYSIYSMMINGFSDARIIRILKSALADRERVTILHKLLVWCKTIGERNVAYVRAITLLFEDDCRFAESERKRMRQCLQEALAQSSAELSIPLPGAVILKTRVVSRGKGAKVTKTTLEFPVVAGDS